MMKFVNDSGSRLALALGALLLSASALAATDTQGQSLGAAQNRLEALRTAGVPTDNYNWAKAKCWLEAANTAYSENDRSGFGGQAQQEAEQLLSALEADKNAPPHYGAPQAASLRPDLQAKLKDLQAQAGANCGAQNMACAEVQLARAAHELNRFGRKAAAPYLYVAQCAVDDAQKQVAACAPKTAQRVEKFTLTADALFYFDRSGVNDVLPQWREKMPPFVESLKTWQHIERIQILGYTDRLGSVAYNQKLSQARANTVKEYFVAQGVKADTIEAEGMGAQNPITNFEKCPAKMGRKALIDCLQPDRRIELEVKGLK